MEKKLVVLTAMFALATGLVFAQTMKDSGGDEMAANTEMTDDNAMMDNGEMMNEENAAMNEENAATNEEVMNEENAETNSEMEMNSAE